MTQNHQPWAHVEWFAGGLLRVFGGESEFGQPYRYAIPFKIVEPHVEPVTDARAIEFVGASRQANVPRPSEWRAMREVMRDLGVTMRFERRGGVHPGTRNVRL